MMGHSSAEVSTVSVGHETASPSIPEEPDLVMQQPEFLSAALTSYQVGTCGSERDKL